GLARSGDALEIGLGSEPADLELAPGHPGRPIRFHLASDVGERLALHVVAADRDDGQPLAVAAEQGAHGLAQRLAYGVAPGAVATGDGLHQERAAHPGSVGEGEAALPDTLALHDREPGDLWRQHVTYEAGDLGSVGAIVAVVDLADQAVSGAQPRHHRGALEDRIGAAPEVPGQRNVDGDRLDGVDLSPAQKVVLHCRVVAWSLQFDGIDGRPTR